MKVISACTRDCYDGCSLITRVRDGKITSVEGNRNHPITQGVICQRIRTFAKKALSEHRIKKPLRRQGERGSGAFAAISWDDAISEIAGRIKEATRNYGAASVGLYDTGGCTGILGSGFPLRFINAINGSVTDDTICSAAGRAALVYNFGSPNGYPAERIPDAKLIVLWGINSKWTNSHGAMLVQKAKKRGCAVWVVDPIKTPTAAMGRHLQIKPATDAVLALTIINQIIQNDKHDKDFIDKHVFGFGNLAEIAKKYDIRRAAEMTGLDARDITELATEFISLRPSVIHIGLGMQRQRNGGEMVRTISLIPSIVGQHRGFIYTNDSLDLDYQYLHSTHLRTSPESRFNPLELSRLIREKVLRVLIVINSNPFVTLPNQNALREILTNSDAMLVTHDLFMTDTADFSDIVLPATSMFESFDIVSSYFHDYVNLNEPAVPPLGESKSNVELFRELSRALGLRNKELYEDEEAIANRLLEENARAVGDLARFRRKGFLKSEPRPLDIYETPSGKIEIYSERALNDGLSPIPDNVPVVGTEPYHLITPVMGDMNHSSYHVLTRKIDPCLLISPDDASALKLSDGDMVVIENQHGSLRMPVKISNSIRSGVVVSYVGFWPKLSAGQNINLITSDYVQRYGGNAAYQSTFVKISRGQ